jgi:hypothetical protein
MRKQTDSYLSILPGKYTAAVRMCQVLLVENDHGAA